MILAAAELVGGHGWLAVLALALFGAVSVGLVSGRSDAVRALRGDGGDERSRAAELEAAAITGYIIIVALVIAFIVEIARGHQGDPYTWLCTLGGASYAVSLTVLYRRR